MFGADSQAGPVALGRLSGHCRSGLRNGTSGDITPPLFQTQVSSGPSVTQVGLAEKKGAPMHLQIGHSLSLSKSQ